MLFHCQKVNFSSSLWNIFFIVAVSEYRNVKQRKPGDPVKFPRTEKVLASPCCVVPHGGYTYLHECLGVLPPQKTIHFNEFISKQLF